MKKVFCCLLAVCFCGYITACNKPKPSSPKSHSATQAVAPTESTEITTATTVSSTPSAQTNIPTTTTTTTDTQPTETAPTATVTQSAETTAAATPQTVASPFADVDVVSIELYDTQLFQTEEAVFVKTLTKSEIQTVVHRLSSAAWTYYPGEYHWVKYSPIFAKWALVLTDTDGKRHVLHLLAETVGWASLGTFAGEDSYTNIIAQAKANHKEGVEDFKRYQVDTDTLTYLLSLF